MIRDGQQVEKVEDYGSFLGLRRLVTGVAFRLVPVTENARFPVRVYLNGDTASPVVVRSSDWQGETAFSDLRVDVGPGSGRAGDGWLLYVAPTAQDRQRTCIITDDKGFQATRGAPSRILWSARGPDYDAVNGDISETNSRVYLAPASSGLATVLTALSASATPTQLRAVTWDMGGFKNVLFAVDLSELTNGATWDWADAANTVSMKAELCAAPDQKAFETVTLEPVWEGRADTELNTMSIGVGAAFNAATDYAARTQETAPYMRFYFDNSFGLFMLADDAGVADAKTTVTVW